MLDTAHYYNKDFLKQYRELEATGTGMPPYVTDWDNDNVEDLLVANSYTRPGCFLITFFKGVRKGKELKFLPGVPLFETTSDQKLFPGSHPNFCVADWNNDGVKDLIIGTCVTTNDGSYDHALSWKWEVLEKTYKKNPAFKSRESIAEFRERMKFADSTFKAKGISHEEATKTHAVTPEFFYKNFYGEYGQEAIGHVGYLYVLLGSIKK